MLFGRGRLMARLDRLRRRIDPSSGPASTSLSEAEVRLTRAVEVHFGRQATSTAAADRLMKAIDVLPQAIVVADADGTVVFRSRSAAEFLAARHSDALVGEAITELIAACLSAGVEQNHTVELFGPPRRAIHLRAVPLRGAVAATGGGGGPSSPRRPVDGAFLLAEDVSERHRLEAVRRDFVANISHELKTPVGAVGVLAEALAGETDLEVVNRLAGRLQDESFRVARTIDDLLQLSQIEVSGLPEPEEMALAAVVEAAVDRIQPAAERLGVELRVVHQDRSATVMGNRPQLVSALANLCDNAVKYSEPGGVVDVSTATSHRWVTFTVSDQGVGIPGRDVERIFERFYRVDRARSRDTGGTGLGLAIVRHVVQNHHGTIDVVSREGEGSTFTLRLPVRPDRSDRSDRAPEATEPTP